LVPLTAPKRPPYACFMGDRGATQPKGHQTPRVAVDANGWPTNSAASRTRHAARGHVDIHLETRAPRLARLLRLRLHPSPNLERRDVTVAATVAAPLWPMSYHSSTPLLIFTCIYSFTYYLSSHPSKRTTRLHGHACRNDWHEKYAGCR
jgi:hypothetical protein